MGKTNPLRPLSYPQSTYLSRPTGEWPEKLVYRFIINPRLHSASNVTHSNSDSLSYTFDVVYPACGLAAEVCG